jgi:hypothetical protein
MLGLQYVNITHMYSDCKLNVIEKIWLNDNVSGLCSVVPVSIIAP